MLDVDSNNVESREQGRDIAGPISKICEDVSMSKSENSVVIDNEALGIGGTNAAVSVFDMMKKESDSDTTHIVNKSCEMSTR